MGALVLFAMIGLLGVLGLSSGEDDAPEVPSDPPATPPDDPVMLTGVEGIADFLTGGEGDDTLTGNLMDADVLDGQGGDDLLIVQNGNIATGGEGVDVFDITTGDKATITDFTEGEDSLQILILKGDEPPQDDPSAQFGWIVTEDGVELHDISDSLQARTEVTRVITLAGLTAPPSDVSIVWQQQA